MFIKLFTAFLSLFTLSGAVISDKSPAQNISSPNETAVPDRLPQSNRTFYVPQEYPTKDVVYNDDLIEGYYYRVYIEDLSFVFQYLDTFVYGYYIDSGDVPILEEYYYPLFDNDTRYIKIYYDYSDYNDLYITYYNNDDNYFMLHFDDISHFSNDSYIVIQYSTHDLILSSLESYQYFYEIQDGDISFLEYEEYQPNGLYDSIYDYMDTTIFSSQSLDDFEMELLGNNISFRTWLCHTGSIIFIILILIFCVGFIITLIKFVGHLMINIGG